jgi:hypothetical protein
MLLKKAQKIVTHVMQVLMPTQQDQTPVTIAKLVTTQAQPLNTAILAYQVNMPLTQAQNHVTHVMLVLMLPSLHQSNAIHADQAHTLKVTPSIAHHAL